MTKEQPTIRTYAMTASAGETLPLHVEGAWLTKMLRSVGPSVAAKAIPEMPRSQMDAIRAGLARIGGNSRDGFTYEEEAQ